MENYEDDPEYYPSDFEDTLEGAGTEKGTLADSCPEEGRLNYRGDDYGYHQVTHHRLDRNHEKILWTIIFMVVFFIISIILYFRFVFAPIDRIESDVQEGVQDIRREIRDFRGRVDPLVNDANQLLDQLCAGEGGRLLGISQSPLCQNRPVPSTSLQQPQAPLQPGSPPTAPVEPPATPTEPPEAPIEPTPATFSPPSEDSCGCPH